MKDECRGWRFVRQEAIKYIEVLMRHNLVCAIGEQAALNVYIELAGEMQVHCTVKELDDVLFLQELWMNFVLHSVLVLTNGGTSEIFRL